MRTHTTHLGLLTLTLLVILLVSLEATAGTPGEAKYDIHVSDVPMVGLRSPALDRDNTMYVGGDDGIIYAISSDGTVKWTYNTGSPVTTNAAIYYSPDNEHAQYNGTIYVGLQDGRVLALGPAGNLKWTCHAGSPINASPALAADGTIYVGKELSVLLAITPDGDQKWARAMPDSEEGIYDPVIDPHGTIYFGVRDDNHFYAYNPDGSQKWVTYVVNGARSAAALGKDGTIYFVTPLNLRALWPSGDPKWRVFVGEFGDVDATPVIGHQGMIYVSAHALNAINPDGTYGWVFWPGPGSPTPVVSSVAVDSNGLIYAVGALDKRIYCVAPGGTFVWSYYAGGLGHWPSCPVVGSDGLVYAAEYNQVRALYTGATGPFDGPWPMYRQNAACNARLDTLWSILSQLKDLAFFVAEADLGDRLKGQLVMRLKSAMQSLEAGHIRPTMHKVGAFINHVEAQEGKKIPVEIADALIRYALDIITDN